MPAFASREFEVYDANDPTKRWVIDTSNLPSQSRTVHAVLGTPEEGVGGVVTVYSVLAQTGSIS